MAEIVAGTPTVPGDRAGVDDFARLGSGFEAACERNPAATSHAASMFARRPVAITIAGAELARLIERTFAHLTLPQAEDAPPALRIQAWDETATGVPAPVRLTGARIAADGRFVGFGDDAWVGMYDRATRHLVAAVRAVDRLSYVDRARPFSRLLLVWYADRGCLVLHSGLVAAENQGVLIVGAGRSGKSTTVLACARDGFLPLADDCLALELASDGRWTGHSVYSALLADPRAVRLCGAPATPLADDLRGRALVYIEPDRWPIVPSVPVRAMVMQRVVPDRQSSLAPIGRGEALRMLLPTALAMDSLGMGTRRGFEALTTLLDTVPCHRLLAGADWHAIPRAVRLALER